MTLQSMAVSAIHMQFVFITIQKYIQITSTIVQKNIYKYIYKYLTNAISYSYRFLNPIMAILYPYRFLRLNPKSLSGLKSPYTARQFLISADFLD